MNNFELGKYHNYYLQFYDVVLKKHFLSTDKQASDTLSIGYLMNKINQIFRHSDIDSILKELQEDNFFHPQTIQSIQDQIQGFINY